MNRECLDSLLNDVSADFAPQVDAIRHEAASFEAALRLAEQEGRDLTIAIVGQVKSGKSSFLNALIFEGDDILPQAATPMTAALTSIRYAEKLRAEVEFFSKEDWQTFVSMAERHGAMIAETRQELEAEIKRRQEDEIEEFGHCEKYVVTDDMVKSRLRGKCTEEQFAAVELVSMAKNLKAKYGIEIESLLGKTQVIDDRETVQDLAQGLQDYVGAGGKYTPLVCSTTLYLNDQRLKGYCLVDTPGTNDPVVSRGKKTMDYLKKADVVIVLSRAGSFFNESDFSLCTLNLPRNGIEKFIVVISKIDEPIRGEATKSEYRSLPPQQRLMKVLKTELDSLRTRFRSELSKLTEKAKARANGDAEKWGALASFEKTPVIGISSMAYILYRHWNRLTDKEREKLDIFNKYIDGFTFDEKALCWLSQMGEGQTKGIRVEINNVKLKKEEILAKRKAELSAKADESILVLIADLKKYVESQIADLQTKDIATLRQEIAEQTLVLEAGRGKLEDVFEQTAVRARDALTALIDDVVGSKGAYAGLAVEEESHTVSSVQYVKRGGLIGGIVDELFGPKAVTTYNTYTTRYANVNQAVEQVSEFAEKAQRKFETALGKAVDERFFRNRLVDAVMKFFEETGRRDEDVEKLRLQVKKAIDAIRLPRCDFSEVDYTAMITEPFGCGRVEDSDVAQLQQTQREVVSQIAKDVECRVREKISEVEAVFGTVKNTFVDDIIRSLKSDSDNLVEKLADKESTLTRWKADLKLIDQSI